MEKEFNPLISPCKCTGTISMIHLKCLKEWLDTKRSMKVHKGQVIVKFKKMDCELCKQMFPFQIAHNNKIVDIVDIEKPEQDFIIFETISTTTQKVFYILNTENKPLLRLGRGQDSDVRIVDDISVSRCHATIRKTPKGYFLEDFNSKFGTLVQVQYPVLLTPQTEPTVFQSGKTCLHVQVREQRLCCGGCLRGKVKREQGNLVSIDCKHFFPKEYTHKHKEKRDAKAIVEDIEDDAHFDHLELDQ